MTSAELDTLAKAPLLVHIAVAYAKSEITESDSRRFKELIQEAAQPNARICVFTDALRHLMGDFHRFYNEVSGASDTRQLLAAIIPVVRALPGEESMRFRSHLGRVAVASARDDAGHPVPAAIEVIKTLAPSLGMPTYGSFSKRFTDQLEIVDYWPGNDPALQTFSEAELRQLAAVFAILYATLAGCHGVQKPELDEAVRHWFLSAYSPGNESSRVHALLRYLDQLFLLVQTEVQFTQSSAPVFEQGYALIHAKLGEEERAVYMQLFQDLGAIYLTPDAPPAVADMHGRISAIMRGEAVAEEQTGLKEEELDLMSLGLIAAFALVAAADGKMSDKEMQSFVDLIQMLTPMQHMGAAVQAMTRIPQAMHRLWPIVTARQSPAPKLVETAVRFVGERLGPEELEAYRILLMSVAEETAKAEGGGFLGLGSKISKEERVVLDGLKKLIGLS